jgi:sugar phosphate isomerase/epimerase
MRLGLTDASYCWLMGGGDMFINRHSGTYDWRGLSRPYFLRTDISLGDATPELWFAERAHQLELPVVHASVSDWSENGIARLRETLAINSQELVPAIGFDMLAEGEDLIREIDGAVAAVERYGQLGGVSLAKLCLFPMIYNRFQRDPDLREQLRRIKAALPPVVRAAEKAGIVLALENHLDYRVSEIVEIIEAVDSPYLRLLFDIGNPFAVCEDPVEVAGIAAPYTALVHVKDVVVLPFTPATAGLFAGMYVCPLGEGNVDIKRIVEILEAGALDPDSLTLSIEISPVAPHVDEDLWVQRGIEWMRKNLASHLSETARRAS